MKLRSCEDTFSVKFIKPRGRRTTVATATRKRRAKQRAKRVVKEGVFMTLEKEKMLDGDYTEVSTRCADIKYTRLLTLLIVLASSSNTLTCIAQGEDEALVVQVLLEGKALAVVALSVVALPLLPGHEFRAGSKLNCVSAGSQRRYERINHLRHVHYGRYALRHDRAEEEEVGQPLVAEEVAVFDLVSEIAVVGLFGDEVRKRQGGEGG